jgi:glycosyltransferase involved in cell wall biosynthesis
VSNLRKEKGLIFLLKAITELNSNEKVFFTVKIIGEGKLRDKLAEFIVTSQIDVVLEGQQEKVGDFYEWADIYLHPSISEGSSNAILEAMSYGLPVFASDTGTAREVLGIDEVIFPPKNVEVIKQLLQQVYEHRLSLDVFGVRNYQRVKDFFQIEKILEEHNNVFKEIVSKT